MHTAELEKHNRYKSHYGEHEIYWGLGIEEESYLQFSKPIYVAAPIIRSAHKPERYSVNYYNSYKAETLTSLEQMFTDTSGFYSLPFLFNAHSFTRMDTRGKHMTTYEKIPKPNPAFSGKTFMQELQSFNPEVFVKEYDRGFVFDGDTIEFITQDFYNTDAQKVVNELVQTKERVLKAINACCKEKGFYKQYGGRFVFPSVNPGFAVFYSNPSNIAIFNNGTYHINITLPSILGSKDADGRPTLLEPELFKIQHKKCIRAFQWIEPLLIAMYGTPDPFCNSNSNSNSKGKGKGSKSSQRAAMSRFMGIGTYDTNIMPEGKIVTKPVKDIRGSSEPFWWYKVYHEKSAYNPLTHLGMDINYRKHHLHGIELRIFDWFPESRLFKLIEFLVYVAQASLTHEDIVEPVMSKMWNDLLVRVLQEGSECELKGEEIAFYEHFLGISLLNQDAKISVIYGHIFKALKYKYGNKELSHCFLRSNHITVVEKKYVNKPNSIYI